MQEAYQGILKEGQEQNPVDNQRHSKNENCSKQAYFFEA
jgi:hypothetical protein